MSKAVILILIAALTPASRAQTSRCPPLNTADIRTCNQQRFNKLNFPQGQEVCSFDHTLIDALKVEIARSLCISRADSTCLLKYNQVDYANRCNYVASVPGGTINPINNLSACLSSPARLTAFRSGVNSLYNVFNNWIKPDSTLRIDITEEEKKSFEASLNIASDLYSVVSSVVPLPSAITKPWQLTNSVIRLISPQTSGQQNLVDQTCSNWGQRFIGAATVVPEGSTTEPNSCVESYSIQQTTVRDFLNQNNCFTDEKLKCAGTCQYYSRLLAFLHTSNNHREKILTDHVRGARCEGTRTGRFSVRTPMPMNIGLGGTSGGPSHITWTATSTLGGSPPSIDVTNNYVDNSMYEPTQRHYLSFRPSSVSATGGLSNVTYSKAPPVSGTPSEGLNPIYFATETRTAMRNVAISSAILTACCELPNPQPCISGEFSSRAESTAEDELNSVESAM